MVAPRLVALAALSLILAASACSDRQASGAPTPASAAPTAPKETPAEILSAAVAMEKARRSAARTPQPGDDSGDTETKKRRFPEPMVYLDGEAIGALKFLELPVKLAPRWVKVAEDYPAARRFSVADYLE